jgi:peptidoglycan/xylan/chitin deacetylase (PgdA/CDA1 family)
MAAADGCLPSFAEGHGCKPVDECEVGTLRSLSARPSQPKRLLRRSRQGGCASEGSARRSLWRGATAVRPWGSTWKILLRWVIAGALYYSGLLSLYRLISGKRNPIILNYHRVLDPAAHNEAVPAGMVVRPQTFAKHLRYLKRRYRVVSMEQLIESRERNEPTLRLEPGPWPGALAQDSAPRAWWKVPRDCPWGSTGRPLCAITFDDGWRDNYEEALPLLRRYGLPATLFISTGFMGNGQTPWFYRLGHVLHALAGSSDDRCAALRSNAQLDLPAALVAWLAGSKLQRQRDIETVIEAMKTLPGAELESAVERLRLFLASAGQNVNGNDAAMLDWEQVREMAQSSFEIGSHGVTHLILTQIPEHAMQAEVFESKLRIEEQLRQSVGGFSYPNGDYSVEVESLVRTAGYRYACTTKPGAVEPCDSPYQLKRIRVHDDVTFSTALFACHIAGVFKLV